MASKKQKDLEKKEKAIADLKKRTPEQLSNMTTSPFQHVSLYRKQALNEVLKQNKIKSEKSHQKYGDELKQELD